MKREMPTTTFENDIVIPIQLNHDLRRLCKQIGIRDDEIPWLEFNKYKVMNLLNLLGKEKYYPQSGYGRATQRRLDTCVGLCYYGIKMIYVEYDKDDKHRRSYEELYLTLVHELVHYRFPSVKHGKRGHSIKFDAMMDSILKGDRYREVKLFP